MDKGSSLIINHKAILILFKDGAMSLFEWKNEYSLGNLEIDEQHKRLFVLANSVYNISVSNNDASDLDRILVELKDYTVYHFQSEEKIFSRSLVVVYGYHKAEHDRIRLKVNDFVNRFESGEHVDVVDFLAFLVDWLIEHIQGMDKKHFAYLKDR